MRGGTGRLPGRDVCQDGTFTRTGRCLGSRHVYVSIVFIACCLYGGGTFFVSPSRDTGLSDRDPGLSGTIFAI